MVPLHHHNSSGKWLLGHILRVQILLLPFTSYMILDKILNFGCFNIICKVADNNMRVPTSLPVERVNELYV